MIRTLTLPGISPLHFQPGLTFLSDDQPSVASALGYTLFGIEKHDLGRAGQIEVELDAPLDGRPYSVSRSLEVPDQWTVRDPLTGWTTAAGSTEVQRWLRQALAVARDLQLPQLFGDVQTFSLPATVLLLRSADAEREAGLRQLFHTNHLAVSQAWIEQARQHGREHTSRLRLQEHALQALTAALPEVDGAFATARQAFVEAEVRVANVERDLAVAREACERHAAATEGLAAAVQDVDAARRQVVSLEAQDVACQQWLALHDRAGRAMLEHQDDWRAYTDATAQLQSLAHEQSATPSRLEAQAAQTDVVALQHQHALLLNHLEDIRAAEQQGKDLMAEVRQQEELEQQLSAAHERTIRLDVAHRALHSTEVEMRRVELQLAEVERQIADLELITPEAQRTSKLQRDIESHNNALGAAIRDVDQSKFVEIAAKAVTGYLDDLRKGAAAAERLTAAVGSANGGTQAAERTVSGHLREAVERQIQALERQVRDWQAQERDLGAASLTVTQLRSTLHQLEQELAAARKLELRVASSGPLRSQRKQLHERHEQLRQLAAVHTKERDTCADAGTTIGQMRTDLGALDDPRSQRLVLLRIAAGKEPAEAQLRQLRRQLTEAEKRLAAATQRADAAAETQERLNQLHGLRENTHAGYSAYVANSTLAEAAAWAVQERTQLVTRLQAEQHAIARTEARQTELRSQVEELQPQVLHAAALEHSVDGERARLTDAQATFERVHDAKSAIDAQIAALATCQVELDHHRHAIDLLDQVEGTLSEVDNRVGSKVRAETAAAASPLLHILLDEPGCELVWQQGAAPAVSHRGEPRPFARLSLREQGSVALAVRLALASKASAFSSVLVIGLLAVPGWQELRRRVELLPAPAQMLLLPGW